MILAGLSLATVGGIALLAFFLLMAFLAWRNPGRNSGFLEWDPEANAQWRGQAADADLGSLLEKRNAERARQGLAPQDIDEYREQLRREGAD